MKKLLMFLCFMLIASFAQAEPFAPTPMEISATDEIIYQFNQSPLDVTFDLTGKPGTFYLVINSKLSDAQKPQNVHNGFKGWHYVNNIDTTIYVSGAYPKAIGNDLVITWNGKGNERAPQDYTDGAYVPAGTYSYYIWGFDSVNSRVSACNFIAVGAYWESQYTKFYEKGENGMKLDKPMLMGSKWTSSINGATVTARIANGTHFKWQMGGDPADDTLLETTLPTDFKRYGPPQFNLTNWNEFFFVMLDSGDNKNTAIPSKWEFVTNGTAILDTDWNDWGGYEMFHPSTKDGDAIRNIMLTDEQNEYLWVLQPGQNPHTFQWDKLAALSMDDCSEQFDILLQDFFMPENSPNSEDGATRTASEINRVFNRFDKKFAVTGDWSCLMEMIDGSRILEDPAKAMSKTGPSWTPSRGGADGYVVWATSNGDYFLDNSSSPDAPSPWACIVSDPRNADNQRRAIGGIDQNGFLVSYLCFAGVNSISVQTQDGSGIGYMQFADDAFSSGGTNKKKKNNGTLLDNGSLYDGLYASRALLESMGGDSPNSADGCMFLASDSDGGIITDGIAVKETAPTAFTVAQNSPNPFNPKTTVTYTLAKQGRVTVDVYNVAGQKIDTLVNDMQSAGTHSVVWNAAGHSAGTYFCKVNSAGVSQTIRMTLLK